MIYTVFLREKSSYSSGRGPIEATDELSAKLKQIAVDTFKALPSIFLIIISQKMDLLKCVKSLEKMISTKCF